MPSSIAQVGGAVEAMMALRNITLRNHSMEEYAARRTYFAGNAIGGYPSGTPIAWPMASAISKPAYAGSRFR